jgi:ethanolamine utilization protein EutQ (cupin superfamily)
MIIIEGEAKQMHSGNNDIGSIERGDVLFIPQLVKCTFTEPSEDFLAFRAFTPPPKK